MMQPTAKRRQIKNQEINCSSCRRGSPPVKSGGGKPFSFDSSKNPDEHQIFCAHRDYAISVFERLFLLPAPCLEDKPCGQKLNAQHLQSLRQTEDGDRLVAVHVLNGLFDDLLRSVIAVKVAYGVVVYGMAEKFGLYPAGTNRHNAYVPPAQLNAQRLGKAQNICLGCAVNIYIRNRLERGH